MEDRQTYIVEQFKQLDIEVPTPISVEMQDCLEEIARKIQDCKELLKSVSSSNTALGDKNRQLLSSLDRMKDSESEARSEVKRLLQVISLNASKHKDEKDKLIQERDDLRKEIMKMTSREIHYQHEIKKSHGDYSKLKEKYRRAIMDKETVQNTFEASSALLEYCEREREGNETEQFLQMVQGGYQNSMNRISAFNESLMQTLQKSIDCLDSCYWNITKREIETKTPLNNSNFCRFVEQKIEKFQALFLDSKENCENDEFAQLSVKELKELLKSYKNTLKDQEDLIKRLKRRDVS